jgi:CheY-like chemotaxis protein
MSTRSDPILILIVEDHPDTRELFTFYLKDRGYSVETASLGTEALRIASELRPDLIVLDVALGGLLTGHDVCRALRAEPHLAQTPILVVSAYSEEEDRQLARDAGSNAFLAKPCLPDSLIQAVESLLERRGTSPDHARSPGRSR